MRLILLHYGGRIVSDIARVSVCSLCCEFGLVILVLQFGNYWIFFYSGLLGASAWEHDVVVVVVV